jgi:hypothetical protein
VWIGKIEHPAAGAAVSKGTPPVSSLRITSEAGSEAPLDIGLQRDADGQVTAEVGRDIDFVRFPVCPICLTGDPDTREHVPHGAIGGQVKTLTCARCNNQLGRFEAELTRWCFGELGSVRAEADVVVGKRRILQVLLRWTDGGEFVLIVDERADPAFRDMLRSGQFSMFISPPDPRRYRIAALKHAYLAACCQLGSIPASSVAEETRADLVAARDAVAVSDVADSHRAGGLRIMRSTAGPQGPALALARLPAEVAGDSVWISLAGSLLVAWPLPDVSPDMS